MFDLWRAQRAKAKLDKAYGKEAEALRKAGKHREREEKLAEWSADGQLAEDEINEILAERLIKKARRWDVPLPPYPIEGAENQYEFWDMSNLTGRYILTRKGRALMRDSLRKEKRERFESKARWITLFTGITGAGIGLVSVLTNLLVRLLGKAGK
jgi:hypothetical protein